MSDGRMMMGPGGQQIGQLPGGMTHQELENRQELEYDVVMAQHLQKALLITGDLVNNYSNNPVFEKMPDREVHGKAAMLLHADFAAMQVTLLESIRKKMKGCRPMSDRKDLKLRDIRDGSVDVLMDPASDGREKADEKEL